MLLMRPFATISVARRFAAALRGARMAVAFARGVRLWPSER